MPCVPARRPQRSRRPAAAVAQIAWAKGIGNTNAASAARAQRPESDLPGQSSPELPRALLERIANTRRFPAAVAPPLVPVAAAARASRRALEFVARTQLSEVVVAPPWAVPFGPTARLKSLPAETWVTVLNSDTLGGDVTAWLSDALVVRTPGPHGATGRQS